jgi:hypothetical protein
VKSILNPKVAKRFTLVAGVLLLISQAAAAKPWRGIVPLHSTRADVERLLGPPTLEEYGYQFEDEMATITYSSRTCEEGLPGGWNIPLDTVVEIRVSLGAEISVADALPAGRSFEQIYAIEKTEIDYLDVEDGVRYTARDGRLMAVTYIGSAADEKKLSCGPYKYAAPVPEGAQLNRFAQYPFDFYGSKASVAEANSRLDGFAHQLSESNQNKSNYRGFILVYAGRAAHAQEAKKVADCAKNYLVKVRQANPDEIIAVDAGYQDEFKVELYIMPKDAYPPLLKPTVGPKKVQILEGEFNPCKDEK